MRLIAIIALLASLLFSPTAMAQVVIKPDPEIINWGGTAFSWPKGDRKKYKSGDPLYVYDVVSALDDETLTDADCTKWSLQHKGITWCFTKEANLAKFKKSIDEDGDSPYEPLFGSRCALGTSWGIRSPAGDPRTFEVIEYRDEKRVVLQSHNKWRAEFRADQPANLSKAALAHNIYRSLGAIAPSTELKKGQ